MRNHKPLALLMLVGLAAAARPDQIVLKSGKVIHGTIVAEADDRVSLQVSDTISLDVRRDQIARVIRGKGSPRTHLNAPPVAPDPTPPDIKRNRKKLVCFIQVNGPIESELMVAAVHRSCAAAAKDEASLVVFEIDTPGGRLDLMLEIVALIERLHPIPTIAYVSGGPCGGAYSAGAVLAMACGETFMAPGTAIGAAAPVAVKGKKTAVDEKYISAVRAKMRSLAQKNGYPPKIAAAMVDAEIEIRQATVNGKATFLSVGQIPAPAAPAAPTTATPAEPEAEPEAEEEPKIQLGDWVTKRGKLLTLTAIEAQRYEIATDLVPSRAQLIDTLDLTGCQVSDLRTTDLYEEGLRQRRRRLTQLEAKITAYEARAVARDPRKFRYARHPKKHGIYNAGDFLDNGRGWRARSSTCIKLIDGCLAACRELMVIARENPELRIATAPLKPRMARLVALRERVLGEYGLKGSER